MGEIKSTNGVHGRKYEHYGSHNEGQPGMGLAIALACSLTFWVGFLLGLAV